MLWSAEADASQEVRTEVSHYHHAALRVLHRALCRRSKSCMDVVLCLVLDRGQYCQDSGCKIGFKAYDTLCTPAIFLGKIESLGVTNVILDVEKEMPKACEGSDTFDASPNDTAMALWNLYSSISSQTDAISSCHQSDCAKDFSYPILSGHKAYSAIDCEVTRMPRTFAGHVQQRMCYRSRRRSRISRDQATEM